MQRSQALLVGLKAPAACVWGSSLVLGALLPFSHQSSYATLVLGKPLPADFEVPHHSIEDGLPELPVLFRQDSGKRFAKRFRDAGLTPAALSGLPGNFFLHLTMDTLAANKQVRTYGRHGIMSRVFKLLWTHPVTEQVIPIRALPRVVHINSQTLQLENISWVMCLREAVFDVEVPIQLENSEVAPGVKKGGWLHVVNRTATLRCLGSHIPPRLTLDMRHMDVHHMVRFQDLQLPEGCQLVVPDVRQPVVRCTVKVGGD